MSSKAVAAHGDTTRLDVHLVAEDLISHLGGTLVAALAGSRDSKAAYEWAKVEGSVPRKEAEKRLRTAHRIWAVLAEAESDHTARTWFTGLNPALGRISPVMALREGRSDDVALAAQAFVDGIWSA